MSGGAHATASSETSRVVRIHETGGPDVLRMERRETPTPGPGEVLLHAIGLNRKTPFPLLSAMQKQLRVQGYTLFQIVTNPAWLERSKAFVTAGLESGALRPVIARTFPLDDIVGAHRFMESNQQTGKIVVVP